MNPRIRRRAVLVAFALWGGAVGLTLPAAAQLHAGCFISAFNRTAQVQDDGTWVLPNVPANQGPVRIRATCVDNGILESGQSELFTLPPDEVLQVPEIVFGDPVPIPVALELSSSLTRLESVGQTLQVTALAIYSDGSEVDVTASSLGTGYRSSNPAIASVDAEGVVTAHTSGVVLISALNEGALGVLELTAVVSGDSDGDGLPDDYEAANGLDPGDPLDALDDPDHDGLTTLHEFQAGLKPFDADTDDDGLRDGEELSVYHTNPLLFDTDGDEVSDGLEIQSGSDPLDPASFNLGPILTGITVQPSSFTLVFNTVLGEASRRLDVRGNLVDGRTIDLRRRSRGTNYGSSDLTVVSFGAEDGRVFAGQNGTATVTVTSNGFSATAAVTVTSFSPTAVSYLPIPGSANGVDVSGRFAYVAAGQAGLVVVDVSVLEAPRIAGAVDTPGNANEVRVDGGFAYVADGAAGLTVVDVRNPAQPLVAGRRDTPGTATDVIVRGGRAYVADGPGGLQIIDVTDPASPVLLGGVDTPGFAHGVDADGILAVVADGSAGVEVYDVRDPAGIAFLGSTHTRPNSYSQAMDVVLRGQFAYVADGAAVSLGGLRIVDVQDPFNPVVVGSSSDSFGLTSLALDGRLVLASDYYFPNTVPIFDTGGPTPQFSARLDFYPTFIDADGNGIAVQNGVAYLTATQGITENGEVASGGLFIGRYLIQPDDRGIPPRISLTSPVDGASAPERSPLVVQADASDDLMVASVQFLIDGVPFSDDTKAPFEAVLTVPASGSFTLGAVATDFGGNRAAAQPVHVTVVPDDKPRITLLAPVAGQRFSEGVVIDLAASASDDVRVDQVEFFIDGQLSDVRFSPPYRSTVLVPIGAEQFTVRAVATDSAGQIATSETVVVGVDDDLPPAVAVVAPTPGTELVAGSRIVAGVGATDPQGVTRVQLAVNGQPLPDDLQTPYLFPLQVPAGSELVLTATAEDTIGQQSTTEARYTIAPDPGTTAEGRVVDSGGFSMPGATVRCLGVSGVSGADGSFSIPGVPTTLGLVSCGATVASGGDSFAGRSAAVPPVRAGQTSVGDIVVKPQILYLGSGNGPGAFEAGRLLVLDSADNRYVPWSSGLPPAGLSGLAFDGQDRLLATTAPPQLLPTLQAKGARPTTKIGVGSSNGSQLVRLDPDTGAVLAVIGPVTVEGGGSDLRVQAQGRREIGVQDLTFDPATGRYYALEQDFGNELFTVDPATGDATVLTSGLSYSTAALALGPDGLLYFLAPQGPSLALSAIDPATGTVLFTDSVTGSTGATSEATVGGMTLRPGAGTFLVTAAFGETDLYELDPLSRQLTQFSQPAGAVEGGLLALAFRPLTGSTAVATTLTGRVVDADGAPVAGAEVSSVGAFGTTGPDGRFDLPGVLVRTATVRVAVRSGVDLAFSAAVPPLTSGITDLGTITLGAPVCVTGTFVEFRCVQGPVTEPLDLYIEDEPGHRMPVGQVIPDPTGRFCADLRPGRRYFARREDVACPCGQVSPCEAFLQVTDPGAAGTCGGAGSSCQELGDVQLFCDFFCGS